MRRLALVLPFLAIAGCGTTYDVPTSASVGAGSAAVAAGSGQSRSDFTRVAARVEPVAESLCREELGSRASCDFQIRFISDPDAPPNAAQTVTQSGRPVIIMTAALLDQARSNDEIAFVLSHETAHHIAQHIPKQQSQQMLGAMLGMGIASALGGDFATDAGMQQAMEIGASFGGRAYSQSFELEADWLGAFIADRAGYAPERGAQIFSRPSLSNSGGLLSTHPASPRRQALVARATEEIRRQRAAGLTPKPGYAR